MNLEKSDPTFIGIGFPVHVLYNCIQHGRNAVDVEIGSGVPKMCN